MSRQPLTAFRFVAQAVAANTPFVLPEEYLLPKTESEPSM
jgi:hypothetical protein